MIKPEPMRPRASLAQRALSHTTWVLLLCVSACNRSAQSDSKDPSQPSAAAPKSVPVEIWKEFNGERALSDVRKQVNCGPRPSGSKALAQARGLLSAELSAAGWTVESQEFTAETPYGRVEMVNLIARFPTRKGYPVDPSTQKVLIGSHYDTKRFSTISFVGANDGASSSGALVELGRVLAMDPALASQVELVFFDGEEALQQFSETDGLYGSRHYAQQIRTSGRHAQFRYGMILDMIGDRNLSVTLPLDSPRELTQGLLASAEALQSRQYFRIFDRPVLDDHVPLNQIARIPTIDVIDFDYTPWHTADDTLEQLSANSLQIIGSITLHYLKHTLQ